MFVPAYVAVSMFTCRTLFTLCLLVKEKKTLTHLDHLSLVAFVRYFLPHSNPLLCTISAKLNYLFSIVFFLYSVQKCTCLWVCGRILKKKKKKKRLRFEGVKVCVCFLILIQKISKFLMTLQNYSNTY